MTHEPHSRPVELLRNATRLGLVCLACLGLLVGAAGAFSGGVAAASGTHAGPRTAAAASQSDPPLIVSDSIVISGDTALAPGQSDCGVTNQFYHGQKAVFRIKVIDPQTGQPMNDSQLQGVSVHITSGGGQTLPAKFGTHGPDQFWAVAWTVPASFPSGQVNYTIDVTGQQAQTVSFAVPPSQLTVLNKSVNDLGAASSGGSTPASGSPSLPLVFWVVVIVVAAVVIGLVWDAERQ